MGALVWLASYPKSGNTWVRAFLLNLLRDKPEPADINALDLLSPSDSLRSWYEPFAERSLDSLSMEALARLRPSGHKKIAGLRSDPILVKTHNFLGAWHGVPLHTGTLAAGGVYVVRNPLDVAISLQHHFGMKTVDEAILFMSQAGAGTKLTAQYVPEFYSTWSGHVESWTKKENSRVLILRYEDLLEEPVAQFGKLAQFLGIRAPIGKIEQAVTLSSFDTLKAQELEKGFRERAVKADAMFFREGRRDQWREVLSSDQVRRIVADHREQMLRFDYVPEDYCGTSLTSADASSSGG
ncbi:MAG: sulfotransferase domain-containing protein [Parvibaculum sp.]